MSTQLYSIICIVSFFLFAADNLGNGWPEWVIFFRVRLSVRFSLEASGATTSITQSITMSVRLSEP